jgi:putative ABC transport system ATP-binding protein
MIEVKNVIKKYTKDKDAKRVLDDVSFNVKKGEFISIIGTSGSGKTTLLNLIGGLDTHYDGEVISISENLKKISDKKLSEYRNKNIGFVFQNFNLLSHLTVEENIKLPERFGSNKYGRKRVEELLKIVGISEQIDKYPNELSGGQKQRVAIARALFNKPELLLCDEPTGNLDRDTGIEILNFFRKLNREFNITIFIITHELHIAELTDRVIKIENGCIESDETTKPNPNLILEKEKKEEK